MKIFVDANVLFTAAYSPSGKASLLLEVLSLYVISSDYAAEEARRNILAKKPSTVSEFNKIIGRIRIVPTVIGGACPIELPDKDRPIFLAALKVKATHLLTGDIKDFGPYMNKPEHTAGIVIQTVSDFLRQ